MHKAVQLHIDTLLKDNIISSIIYEDTRFIGKVFPVPKPDDTLRLILDVSKLNTYLKVPKFSLVKIDTVSRIINKLDFMTKIDLKSAYWQVPLHPSTRPWMSFAWGEKYYCFKVLPFGVASAPYFFDRITKPIISYLHKLKIKVVVYLDDFLIIANRDKIQKNTNKVLDILTKCGFKNF